MVQHTSQVLALIIQCATIITLIYTVVKFAGRPNASQNERLDNLEKWRRDVELRLQSGSDHFRSIDESNRVTQEALLALLEHEIDGNHTDKLKEAKDNLQSYLIRK